MPNYRCQVRLQGATNLPEDVYVNTYHFVRLDDIDAAADDITPDLEDLYGTLNAHAFPAYIQRTVQVNFYDLADAIPRVPTVRFFDLPTAAAQGTMPFEVALVVSFHGSPPVTARRRGRVYIGPMSATASEASAILAPHVGNTVVVNTAGAFATFLEAQPGWSIRSTVPSENFVTVEAGWVDNEFDTQRRRGHTATDRLVWTVVP